MDLKLAQLAGQTPLRDAQGQHFIGRESLVLLAPFPLLDAMPVQPSHDTNVTSTLSARNYPHRAMS